ncbi:MAG: hypothetical protein U9R00_02775 [Patescibacteria group bacterium]|nr:hypothetical protein [Patescibacteria group bacterium]
MKFNFNRKELKTPVHKNLPGEESLPKKEMDDFDITNNEEYIEGSSDNPKHREKFIDIEEFPDEYSNILEEFENKEISFFEDIKNDSKEDKKAIEGSDKKRFSREEIVFSKKAKLYLDGMIKEDSLPKEALEYIKNKPKKKEEFKKELGNVKYQSKFVRSKKDPNKLISAWQLDKLKVIFIKKESGKLKEGYYTFSPTEAHQYKNKPNVVFVQVNALVGKNNKNKTKRRRIFNQRAKSA